MSYSLFCTKQYTDAKLLYLFDNGDLFFSTLLDLCQSISPFLQVTTYKPCTLLD